MRPQRLRAGHSYWSYLFAAALAVAAVLIDAVPIGAQKPAGLICLFALLISALVGGYAAGWLALVITAGGLWLLLPGSSTAASDFQSGLVLWCAYLGLGIVLIEVIRRQQRERLQLLEHDQRLRLARRAARIWFWEWDLQSNLLRWSREAEYRANEGKRSECYQLAIDEYINRRVHPEDRERVLTSLFEAAARHHRLELEYRVVERDGAVRWLSSKGKIFEENGTHLMLGMASEITAQKQAEEVRSHFRAVLGSLTEGVCYINTSGAIQYLNAAAERMLGYKSEQVRGKQLHQLVHIGCDTEGGCCLVNAMRAGHSCWVEEETLITKSGEKLVAEYTAAPVSSDGIALGAVMMFRDLSERKRAEAALRASEKMAATGRIAATISHELRNPLDSVIQLLYVLKQSSRLGDPERQQLELIDQELHRMTEVTQQTLAMHRQSSSMVPVNFAKLLDGVLLLYGNKIRASKIRVERRYDWLGEIPGFPAELRQVFTNLIVNAVEAMPSGGGLRVHIRRTLQTGAMGRDGVVVFLLDTGMGIPKDVRKRIFEPFFSTKGEKGSGVGLWVSSGIVERHHGTIRVHSDSRPGRSYTCFQVFLPEKQNQIVSLRPSATAPDRKQAERQPEAA
ncbi:MAG TPA: PAS domain S-box protein [Terriglobales bacterium]|nr:PAS domain S-box protein [Terriglobales bacterium]